MPKHLLLAHGIGRWNRQEQVECRSAHRVNDGVQISLPYLVIFKNRLVRRQLESHWNQVYLAGGYRLMI